MSAPKIQSAPINDLPSKWTAALGVHFWAEAPSRMETEVADLVVYGEIPKEIDGTFYRIMPDPFYPPSPENSIPIEGDGHLSAFRIRDGQVDMKTKYVDTERLKLERKANKRLFGLYRNPFTHHPCVRAAVDSTANTNMVYWAGHLLALKEVGLPYQMDPDTLETIKYDPFEGQVAAKTFTAHPKVDPFSDELVVFGYEAKGLATLDIVVYALNAQGEKQHEQWIKAPWPGMIHDCAITPNFVILVIWPFETDLERMKAGKHHWAWNQNRPVTFIVVPRRPETNLPTGWKGGKSRVYEWDNCLPLHTAGAWEVDGGVLYMESSRVFDNELPLFSPSDEAVIPPTGKADFVRWKFDLSLPSGARISEPHVVLDLASEFPRIDERFMTKSYTQLFLNVVLGAPAAPGVIPSLNGLAMVNTQSGKTEYFSPGKTATWRSQCLSRDTRMRPKETVGS